MAILMAMMTLALVATLAAGVLWQQWRSQEEETSSRYEEQATWLLGAALDWARVILSEDAKASTTDNKTEPWSIPLQETQLSSFLAASNSGVNTSEPSAPQSLSSGSSGINDGQAEQIYISGRITDLQSRLNIFNLYSAGQVSTPDLNAFTQLFKVLGLSEAELNRLVQAAGSSAQVGAMGNMATTASITTGSPGSPGSPGSSGSSGSSGSIGSSTSNSSQASSTISTNASPSPSALIAPQRIEQLSWSGLSPQTLATLSPYVIWLPVRTPVNLNTASAQVLAASFYGLSLSKAQKLVQTRDAQPWSTLDEASRALNSVTSGGVVGGANLNTSQFALNSSYFQVFGKLRFDSLVFTERSVLQRTNQQTLVLWRERRALGAEPGCFSTIEPPC